MAGLLRAGRVLLYCGGWDGAGREVATCWQLRSGRGSWEGSPALPRAAVLAAQVSVCCCWRGAAESCRWWPGTSCT